MQAPRWLKDAVYPARGNLTHLKFKEGGKPVRAFVPDDETWGLTREVLLERLYDPPGGLPSGVVIDCGAHVGLFTMLAAARASKVVCVEPDPVNFRLLQANIALNGYTHVEAVNAALWDEAGSVAFETSWHTTGGRVKEDGDVTVATVTLDDLLEPHAQVDLLKIDVEGAEERAIPASKHLHKVRRVIAELHLREAGQERGMVDALRGHGFTVEIVPAASFYTPARIKDVAKHWRSVEGRLLIKLGVVAYLLAPVEKPRRPQGSRDMPLLVATRA